MKMNKKHILGAVIATVMFIAIGVSSVFSRALSDSWFSNTMSEVLASGEVMTLPKQSYIAVVTVEGTIEAQQTESAFGTQQSYRHSTTLEYIDHLISDQNNKGILLYVDSPGGTVYESEELYLKLAEYKEHTDRPIWNYMAHYAASGGYYVAMMSDYIYANPNTTTGSIGVIMSGYDLSGLYEKLGIRDITITSGENKASTFSDDQIQIYQSIVDEYYGRFVEIIAEGRNMSEEEVKALADGRIYSARQAKEHKLIDEIGLYTEMQEAMSEELGVDYYYTLESQSDAFSRFFSRLQGTMPKSEAQILKELSLEKESGVWMYYAEILQ